MTTFRQLLKGRFAALGVIVLVVLGGLTVRLWSMQVLSGDTFAAAADENRIRQVSLPAARGRILDAKGRPLVTNRPVMAITAEPKVSEDATLVARISAAIDVPVAEIEKRLSSYKQERLAPRVLRVDVSMQTVSYILEHAPDFPGVSVTESAVREYPSKGLAAHALGYTGEISESQLKLEKGAAASTDIGSRIGDIVGKTGVEAYYDKALQGEKGFRRLEVDNQGRVHRVIAEGAPRAGKDIQLTIDMDVQVVAEKALQDALDEAHRQNFRSARAGAAVVLDVRTGAVIAMASAPTYDPSLFLNGIKDEDWKSLTATSSEFPLTNRAVMSAYPPASTFKAVVAMAGLKDKLSTPSSYYNCPGHWEGMGKQWGKWCWLHSGHGGMSLTSGIVQSCDSVFYELGKKFYEAKGEPLQEFTRSMGFGSRLGIDLPGEVPGRVPDAAWKHEYNKNYPEYQQWLPGDTVNMAIGQGDLLCTPLQLASAYAALGNDGKVMKPHLLKAVLGADGKPAVEASAVVLSDPKLSPASLAAMRAALVGVTEYGTARGVFAGFPITVAGKT
ncbi:MAG: penicillin-binding protein 2, partial [Coriobacteriia bacterium]|nr:penicillin-binding protein 2 [Coriobacteriia bacterium]